VMAYAFPSELAQICKTPVARPQDVCELERQIIGWDHGQIGAAYLERHKLSEEIVQAVRYHNEPVQAGAHRSFACAVQVADCISRHAGITGGFEKIKPVETDAWLALDGWRILFGEDDNEASLGRAAAANAMQKLPQTLAGLF
jgi:HD-like signal output (HDOD) protein